MPEPAKQTAGLYVEDDKVRAEPFAETEIDLNNLWPESGTGQPRTEGTEKA